MRISYKYLIARRFTQIALIALFAGANYFGYTFLMGNYSSAYVLESFYLSDPYAVIQMLLAGILLASDVLIGAVTLFIFYALIGGRAFCSWVCPVNMVSDLAHWLRRKYKIKTDKNDFPVKRNLRYWILGLSLALSALLGIAAFEAISPVSMMHRGIIFGFGFGWTFILAILLFDTFILKDGWCGHLCPLGAFYSLTTKFRFIKVEHNHENCTNCMKCKLICSENQILDIIGKKSGTIASGECTNCGACIEVCDDDALKFTIKK